MSFISKLLSAIGHFFKSLWEGTKKGFEELPEDQQNAINFGVIVSQLIKENVGKSEIEVINIVSKTLNIPVEMANSLFETLAEDLGVVQVVLWVENKVESELTDVAHNALFENIAKFAATFFGGGQVNWVTLGLGVIEYAYQLLKGENKLTEPISKVTLLTGGGEAYQKCLRDHSGQCGTCASNGDFTAC